MTDANNRVVRGEPDAVDSSDTIAPPATRLLQNVAVGVVLTDSNTDAALRTAIRARHRGHTVFVVSNLKNDETLDTLADLGAVVLSPPSRRTSQSEFHQLLSRTARERGLSGIILQTRDSPRIDYDRTAVAFERADYEVIAIPEHWDQTPDTPTIVVGIPAYNAADSIGRVVDRAAAYADEVIVVDDGSRDDTADREMSAADTTALAMPAQSSWYTNETGGTVGHSKRSSARPPTDGPRIWSSLTPTANMTRKTFRHSSRHRAVTVPISSSEAATSVSGRRRFPSSGR